MLSIKYNKDDASSKIKTILFLGLIISLIITVIFYPQWQIIVTGIILIVIMRSMLNKPDGELMVIKKDGKLFLKHNLDSLDKEQTTEIKASKFYWNYIHEKAFSPGAGDGTGKTSHTNTIQLNLELELENDKRILLYEQLNPWQDTPSGFHYKVFEISKYDELLLLNGSMKRLKEEFD